VPTEEFFVMQGNSSIAADPVAFHAVRRRRACGSTPKFKMPLILLRHSAAHNRAELSKIVEKLTGDRLSLERPRGSP